MPQVIIPPEKELQSSSQDSSLYNVLSEGEDKYESDEVLKIGIGGIPDLVSKILEDFEQAKRAKEKINDRLVANLRLFLSLYSPDEEQKIEEQGFPKIFIPLTNIKCRAGKAWLNDLYFSSNDLLFDVLPTPQPTLPDEISQEIGQRLEQEYSNLYQRIVQLQQLGIPSIQINDLFEKINEEGKKLEKEYRDRLYKESKDECELVKTKIHDQFTEGGFYIAFREFLQDLVIYPSAILKGPILRQVKKHISSNTTDSVIIPTYNRVNPFDFFPAPNIASPQDGYIIEILHLTANDLYNLIGVEGFFEDSIRECLNNMPDGYSLPLYGESYDTVAFKSQDLIKKGIYDVIEYWGSIKGSILEEWNVSGVDDKDKYYEICAWVLNGVLIGVVLNPDSLGEKPYYKTSIVEIPDNFWGKSLPDIIEPIQKAVNSLSRAILTNAVFASGPFIEINEDRVGKVSSLKPFQMFYAKESALNSAPAVRFYQSRETAVALIQVLAYYQKMADEYSGIPAYAHGDLTVGGAGRTASGLSMLTSHLTKGIKDILMNIDLKIIEPLVKKQYYRNIEDGIFNRIPDLTIRARGVVNYSTKEAEMNKVLEFLRISSNPYDLQIIGIDGRRKLLRSLIKSMGLDEQDIFESPIDEMEQMVNALTMQLQQQQSTAQQDVNQNQIAKPSSNNTITQQAQDFRRNML